jgi:alginate O-acetyltransferase complex protein AlgJ
MTTPQQPLPAGGPSREAAALMEIAHTTVSPAIVRFLLAFFVGAIAVVPAIEIAAARIKGGGLTVAVSRLADARRELRASDAAAAADDSGRWQRVVSGNRILLNGLSAFEGALEDESLIARSLRPSAQLVMTGRLGAGNERVYPGRDRWLFYRPDVEYLTGRAFLDPTQMRRRVREAPELTTPPQPNPLAAIVRFKNDLLERGITLVVMPTPQKPAVHPDRLTRRYGAAAAVLRNPSFGTFVERLAQEGVLVFEPLEVLAAMGRNDPQYLATDTHWRPEAMEAVAEGLAAFIAGRVSLADAGDPGYRLERVEARNVGDTARMLDLPDGARLFPSETVWLRRVLQRDGSPWRSSRTAEVLVLGDSFSNIYTLESMGWGTSAGFVEQLSYALRRPVDRLVQNDEGAFATRVMLTRSRERLEGKRVVVYQFAERELAFGDWKLTGLPPPAEHRRGSR